MKLKIDNMIVKAKIDILEPIYAQSGVFYCAGFVNGVYVHILTYNQLTKKKIKEYLFKKYLKDGYLVEQETEGVYYGR